MTDVSRRNFLKKAVPVIAGVGLVGALGADRVFGTTQTPPPSPGTILATASYVISHQKIFYAQNGNTGQIDFSGTDAKTVIQSAVNALVEGGLVFVRRGIYPLTGSIVLGPGIHLLGEQGAVLKVEDNSQSSLNPFNILEVKGDNVTIENLELDGNTDSNPNLAGTTIDPAPSNPDIQSGIMVRSGQNSEIQNCYIHDTWNAGIWLAGTDGEVRMSEIASCLIEATGRSYSDPTSTNPPQSASAIYAFRPEGSTSNSRIHDNVIVDTFGPGIYLHFDTDSAVSNNVITNRLSLSGSIAGISIDDSVKRVIVRGNQVTGYGPGIYVTWAGCEDIIIEANNCSNAPNCGGSGAGISVYTSSTSAPVQQTLIIRGNICKGNALFGISLAASHAVIEGNICYNNNQDSGAPDARKAGIIVQAGAASQVSDILIVGNRCFDDQAVPTQMYGVSVSQMDNQIDDLLISNNDLRGNGIGAIGELDCSKRRVTGNLGYNPRGLAPISVGDSPFTYTNRDGSPQAVYIVGGSVSGISKDGIPLFTSTPATVWLGPDEYVTIAHSDPPRMIKDGS